MLLPAKKISGRSKLLLSKEVGKVYASIRKKNKDKSLGFYPKTKLIVKVYAS